MGVKKTSSNFVLPFSSTQKAGFISITVGCGASNKRFLKGKDFRRKGIYVSQLKTKYQLKYYAYITIPA
jgi:hypothetical protein